MRFWDSSALVPLCVHEPSTARMRQLLDDDGGIAAWWGSAVECASALSRRRRDGTLPAAEALAAETVVDTLRTAWLEIVPTDAVRNLALRLVRTHALRSADAVQLAAALVWAGGSRGEIVVLDDRLAEAASLEGLTPIG